MENKSLEAHIEKVSTLPKVYSKHDLMFAVCNLLNSYWLSTGEKTTYARNACEYYAMLNTANCRKQLVSIYNELKALILSNKKFWEDIEMKGKK
jgi:hypothetical protein